MIERMFSLRDKIKAQEAERQKEIKRKKDEKKAQRSKRVKQGRKQIIKTNKK